MQKEGGYINMEAEVEKGRVSDQVKRGRKHPHVVDPCVLTTKPTLNVAATTV